MEKTGFFGCFKLFYKNYFNFSTRTTRSEFIKTLVIIIPISLIPLLNIINIIPLLSLCVRRLHDANDSPWWIIIPILTSSNWKAAAFVWPIFLVYLCLEHTYLWENEWGKPKNAE